jgi:prepilin-type N-terminal cleavage/methylation domain-containing protein
MKTAATMHGQLNNKCMRTNKGFTLIELLTVIAIIAILAALLFPAVQGALKKAEIGQAQTDVGAIVSAVKAYYTEYGIWPVVNSQQGQADQNFRYGDNISNADLFNVLRSINFGPNSGHALNTRRIVFFDAKTTTKVSAYGVGPDGVNRDPWGNPYIVVMDLNYDGNADFGAPYGIQYGNNVAVVSRGPDGLLWSGTGKNDDILSFRH